MLNLESGFGNRAPEGRRVIPLQCPAKPLAQLGVGVS
jgi:hypothetical protein